MLDVRTVNDGLRRRTLAVHVFLFVALPGLWGRKALCIEESVSVSLYNCRRTVAVVLMLSCISRLVFNAFDAFPSPNIPA